jgi:hypothetical protein
MYGTHKTPLLFLPAPNILGIISFRRVKIFFATPSRNILTNIYKFQIIDLNKSLPRLGITIIPLFANLSNSFFSLIVRK